MHFSVQAAADAIAAAKKPTKKKRNPYQMNHSARRLQLIEDARRISPAVRSVKGAKKVLRRDAREFERQVAAAAQSPAVQSGRILRASYGTPSNVPRSED